MSAAAPTTGGAAAAPGRGPARVPASAPRLITDMLDETVATSPGTIAIDFLGRTWRYDKIGRLVDRCARGLQDAGVAKGTRVALCLPNMPHYVILYFALHRIGAVVVNVNPLYTAREIRHLLQDSGATMIATCDVADYHAKVAALGEELGLTRVIVCKMADALPPLKSLLYRLFRRRDIAAIADDGRQIDFKTLLRSDKAPDPVARVPDDLAVLQYTGGTTGLPKAAMLSHGNLTANCAQMEVHVQDVELADEVVMGVLPLFHVFALTSVLNSTVLMGGTMVLLPRFEMKQFLATMKRTRCTQLFAVPTIYNALNQLSDEKLAPLKSVRFSISGGAPLPFDVRTAFERRVGCTVVEGYGLSEASPVITCNPLGGPIKDNSCGPAFPGTVIEIRDLEDPTRIMPQGEKGEVCARGPQVMQGYWNRPEDTANAFVDGALRTGDVGYLDEDGYLFLVDRIKDMILCGGYNVYPRVIEDTIYEHPAVRDAIVIGIDDAYRGQSPKAFVALKEGQSLTAEALDAFLRERLNKLEMPRRIEFRDELPRTLIGKLSKKELVEEERAKTTVSNG